MLERIPEQLADYQVILEPDRDVPEWWAGAPSVVRAPDGAFYLAARMRHADSPKGQRGYENRILRSGDGRCFEPINHLTREAAGVAGFEHPALVIDPATGKFRLYSCAGLERGWAILKFDDVDDPADFDARTARPVITAEYPDDGFFHVTGHKDPVVYHDGEQWHLFTIGCDRIERIHHFLSEDGESWRPPPRKRGLRFPVIENTGWHNCYTRPASILPMAVGYLFVYEGSHIDWRDPVYNIATGLAYTPDLRRFYDLSPDEPLLKSTTPGAYHTWRYSHWMRVGGDVFVYFEAARPNNTNEVRLGVLSSLPRSSSGSARPPCFGT